mgnify:CR=1 FL=1
MKRNASLFLVLLMCLTLCACGSGTNTWQEQYDLGVRYLSEGNYEEAIIAFTAAIEVDPKNVDAYLSLADAYAATGDYKSAENLFSRAYDSGLGEKDVESLANCILQHPELSITSKMVDVSDFMIDGKEIGHCTLSEFMDMFPNNTDTYNNPLSEREHGGKSGITYTPCLRRIDGSYHTGLIWAWARSVSSKIGVAVFEGNDTVDFDFNSIQTGDNVETVLDKMGLSELGKKCCLMIGSPVTFELSQDGKWCAYSMGQGEMVDEENYGFLICDSQHGGIIHLEFEGEILSFVQYNELDWQW